VGRGKCSCRADHARALCGIAVDKGIAAAALAGGAARDSPHDLAANPARVRLVATDQGVFVTGEVGEPVVPAPVPLVLELPDVEPLMLVVESALLLVLPAPMLLLDVPGPEPMLVPEVPLEPMLAGDVSLGDVLEPALDEPMVPALDEPMLPVLDIDESVLPVDDAFGVTVVVADGVVIVVVAGADVVVVVVVVVVESDERP
jgi:hypothetical protein